MASVESRVRRMGRPPGVEARVPGLHEEPGVLDIGVGMDPAWVGQGHGPAFAGAVLRHYREMVGTDRLRAVVQDWNERSLRLVRSLGFVDVGEHVADHGGWVISYRVLVMPPGVRPV